MDAFQQHNRYMRPPPPPPPATVDPYHHQHHQQQLPPRPPVPPQGSWYSNQFQYHSSQSPSPPPPPQWAPSPPPQPHPHSEHLAPPGSSYHPPPPPPSQLPYPAHPVHHSQFAPPPPPPPRPHVPPHFPPPPPPLPPPHSQIPQSYPQLNQEWGTSNWGHQHHQVWDYSARSNEEDWAAKARAWADAKAAMENQNPQSQFTPVVRLEEQSHYHEQYPQSVDSHRPEIQHQSHTASCYQHAPVSAVPPHQPPVVHPLETTSGSSEPSSYAPEGYLHHTVRDETSSADPNVMFHHGENLPTSSSVHQQEVPSSYSSITGNEGTLEQSEQLHKLLPLPNSSSQEAHAHLQGLQHMPLADQPLDFAPRYNHDHDPHMQSSYGYHDSVAPIRGMDPGAIAPSMNSWTAPVAPGVAYPPMPPVMPSGPQHDSSLAMPPSAPGHSAPPFSSFPGSGLPPTIPSAAAPFSLGAGAALHPSTAFSGDTYGISSVSERPKKASVPNWLREEIKKAVITNSSLDHPKEAQSIEHADDKYLGKGDQADSKSIDSSRSTEDEEDDEDDVEAARTAAINQEIKRVLTEVLLKVTDELFDEIATKVLDEDDPTVEVDQSTVTLNHKVSPSPPAMPLTKATAKVIIPAKAKESENEDIGVKSSSISPGDVLGLANYATDDDDDDDDNDEIQGSKVPNSKKKVTLQHINDVKTSEDGRDVAANDNSSFEQPEKQSSSPTKVENDPIKTSSIESKYGDSYAIDDFSYSKNRKIETNGDENTLDGTSKSKDTIGMVKSEQPENNVNFKKISKDDNQGKETRKKPEKNDHEGKNSSTGKKSHKEGESGKMRKDEKGDDIHRRQDERHARKEKTDERNGSKDRNKELSAKHGEKVKESESKRRSSYLDVKEDRKEPERQHKASAKDEVNRKREHAKDKEEDRSRHKLGSDASRHKRRRSTSSSEASDDSKRKLHSRKHNSSPSPVKSRRRQVSRSPHSKHSQRRHSPYSSLDTNRRRSRSRTPVRRHR